MNILNILAAGFAEIAPWKEVFSPIVFLYLGPETILPIASFIAGIVGVIMMFWRYIISSVRKLLGIETEKEESTLDPNLDLDADIQIGTSNIPNEN